MHAKLTLDSDVAEKVRQEMRRTGRGLKAVVNDVLRRSLGGDGGPRGAARFEVRTFDLRVRPGLDPDRANQLI